MCVYVIMLIFVCFLCYYVYSVKSSWELVFIVIQKPNSNKVFLSYLILSYLILSYLSRGGYILNLHFGRDAICVSGAFLHIKSHYTLMTISQIPTFNPIRFPILTTVGYLVGCQCNTRQYFISEKKCNVRDGIRSQAYSHCKLQ
jgi:hypothetical protein